MEGRNFFEVIGILANLDEDDGMNPGVFAWIISGSKKKNQQFLYSFNNFSFLFIIIHFIYFATKDCLVTNTMTHLFLHVMLIGIFGFGSATEQNDSKINSLP